MEYVPQSEDKPPKRPNATVPQVPERPKAASRLNALPSEASLPLLNLKPYSSLKKTELPFPRSSEPLIPQRLPIQLPFDI